MKKLIFYVLVAIISIVAIPVHAQKQIEVCFAQYRTTLDEYGEILQKTEEEMFCPTRIELNVETRKLTIKTKKYGTAVYTIADVEQKEDGNWMLYNSDGECFGMFTFYDGNQFGALSIKQKNNVIKNYMTKEYLYK